MSEELQEVVVSDWSTFNPGDHQSIKTIIKNNINSVCANYVAIGYYLNNINERKLYHEDGYSGIGEYATAEYGITEDKCSWLRKVAKRFCIENSPALLPEYQGFKVEKLREMVYLTNEQLEQVTITTTRAEIREMKKPEPEKVAPAQVEPKLSILGYAKTIYPPGSTLTTQGCGYKHSCFSCHRSGCDIRQEQCYCVEAPMGNPFGCTTMNVFGNLKADIGDKCMFINLDLAYQRTGDKEPVPCCKDCKEMCGYACKKAAHKKPVETNPEKGITIDDLDLSVMAFNAIRQHGIETIEQLCEHTEKELLDKWKIGSYYTKQITKHLSEIGLSLKQDEVEDNIVDTVDKTLQIEGEVDENVIGEPESVIDEVENVEADIIQTVSEEDEDEPIRNFNPEKYTYFDVDNEIDKLTEYVEMYRKNNDSGPGRRKAKMRYDAIVLLDKEMRKKPDEEEPNVKKFAKFAMDFFDQKDYGDTDFYLFNARKYLADNYEYERISYPNYFNDNRKPQPELPILKNNDQRKEFIDDYNTWPIWIDQKETGERYYRYDFTDTVSMVVKVNLRHSHENYKETKEHEYAAEQYYLLGIKYEYGLKGSLFIENDTRTFYECSTNKSALVDYLKVIQKK